jgi:hypothetical protein
LPTEENETGSDLDSIRTSCRATEDGSRISRDFLDGLADVPKPSFFLFRLATSAFFADSRSYYSDHSAGASRRLAIGSFD